MPDRKQTGSNRQMQHGTSRALAGLLASSLFLTALLLARGGLQFSSSSGSSVRDLLTTALRSATTAGALAGAACDDSAAAAAAAAATPSPWTEGCLRLECACVDQGSILLYGKQGKQQQPFDIEPDAEHFKYDGRTKQAPIHVRPAFDGPPTVEGVAYLRRPYFSRCTVPVVWYSMWPANFAHSFRDNAAKIWGVLNSTSWAQHLKLVLVTGGGQAAPHTNTLLYRPLLRQRVETWADFSARLPATQAPGGYVPMAWPGALAPADDIDSAISSINGDSPISWEGSPQRCFKQLFVCNRGLNITTWPLHGLGQFLVKHYSKEVAEAAAAEPEQQPQQQQPAQQQQPPQQQQQELIRRGEATAGTSSEAGDAGERVLRIIFHKRGSADRQLLNAAELLERCNSWRHTTAAGQRLRASCREAEMSNLFEGMAAAQEADIFVAMHGANQANGWLMRPGSAMVELQPFGFDAGPAHLQYPLFNMEDAKTQVQWWMLSVCDPALSTPGRHEQRGVGDEVGLWSKNRNMRVGWEALEQVLATAVEVAGDMKEYRRRWREGRWWWWLGAGNKLVEVGPGRLTSMRCPPGLA